MGDLATRAFQVTPTNVECCRGESFAKARRVNATKFLTELKQQECLSRSGRLRSRCFDNLSEEKQNAYFAVDVQDEGNKTGGTGAAYLA